MKNRFTSTIAGASILISILGLLGRGLGFFREIIFAAFFGLSSNFEIYLVAAVLPISINTIILYLGQNYFIPIYSGLTHSGEITKNKYLSHSLTLFFGGGLLILAILYVFARPIISFYLGNVSNEVLESAISIFLIFIFTIPLNAVISIISAYLQAERDFFSPAFSQLVLNIMLIILIPIFSRHLSVYIIPIGYLAGTILQFIYLLLKFEFKLKFSLKGMGNKYNRFVGSFLLITLIIEGISQLYLIADRFFLDYVEKGGIAALNYGMTVYYMPIAIFSAALSTAIFPSFSLAFNTDQKDNIDQKIKNSIIINSFMFIPITIIFIFYGDFLIKLLFQRGRFISGDTIITFKILKIYSCSLIFYSSYALLNKIIYSAKSLKALLIITVIGALIKISLNFYLVGIYKQNGLAISSSISYTFLFCSSAYYIYRYLDAKSIKYFAPYTLYYLLVGIICYSFVSILINDLDASMHLKNIISIFSFALTFYFTLYLLKDSSTILIRNVWSSFISREKIISDPKTENI
jgi:putative peptidoglycan lipid II flippase